VTKLRIGLVGCGHIGTVHAYALQQLQDAGLIDAELGSVYDDEPARAAKLSTNVGGRAVESLDQVVETSDVVWVCTWTAAHLAPVAAAVERGLPVFCEKPLAPTLEQCEEIAALLRQVPHQVGLVLRHTPVFLELASILESGRFGRVMAVVFRDDQYFPIQGMYGSTWRSDVAKAGGGTLIEHSIHDVDVLRWLLGGDPSWVTGRTECIFGHPGIEDVATATLAYESGPTASLVSVWHQVTTRPSTRRLEVFCEEAMLWTEDDCLGPLHVETSAGVELVEGELPGWVDRFPLPEVLAKPLGQYAAPSKRFLDGLVSSGGTAPGFPDVDVALAAHRVVDAVYRSAAAGGAPTHPDGSR
jgi:predicted dehydrogenase